VMRFNSVSDFARSLQRGKFLIRDPETAGSEHQDVYFL
jgi:hypothetical protein